MRDINKKTITIKAVVGKPITSLAAAVAPKGLKPMEVQKKITELTKDMPANLPYVVKIYVGAGNAWTMTATPGPTIELLKQLQPTYKDTIVSKGVIRQIAELKMKYDGANTSSLHSIMKTVHSTIVKSCHLTAEEL